MGMSNRAEARRAKILGSGLEARVVAIALVSTITALMAAFAVYQYRNWAHDRDDLADKSVHLAQAIGAAAHSTLNGGSTELSTDAAHLLANSETAIAAAYTDIAGRRLQVGDTNGRSERLGFQGSKSVRTHFRSSGLEVRAPHFVGGRRVGEVVLLVDDRQVLRERLSNIAVALLLSVLATLGAGLVARRMARRALAPLRALDEAMETVAASRDFSARLPIARDDEVGRLTRSFNRLLGGLEDYDCDLRGAMREVSEACEESERANRIKSQFLANMGHELRTPLNGVLGMTQSLLMDDLGELQRERIEVIRESGTALLTVLNDLLDLADMDAGAVSIETAPFELESVIRQACETATTLAESKGLDLHIEIEPDAAGAWVGDAKRLRQVLYNLVSNALKFTAAGGVQVRARVEDGLMVSVTDTGIGIPPDVLPRLFETFTQGDGAATRSFGGVGMGLAICRRVAGLMGGSLEAQSEVGLGSVFTIWLPLERAAPAPEAAVSARHVADLRVLVAEDNETNQRVVRTVLNALGVDPTVVPDGRAAVEAWGRGDWDLVLMDIQMPVRDGVAATRDIRRLEAERGLAPTRIVALTANSMPAQVVEYEAAGMDGIVPKPIMIDQLHAALTAASAGRAA